MAVKTITIDLEAYERLRGVRKRDESFSQAIKRVVPKPIDALEWFDKLDKLGPFSAKFTRAVEEQVEGRRNPRNKRR